MEAIPIEHLGNPEKPKMKETAMTDKTPKTEPETPVSEADKLAEVPVQKPVHDPSTIEVEHDPKDPNSPDYKPADDES